MPAICRGPDRRDPSPMVLWQVALACRQGDLSTFGSRARRASRMKQWPRCRAKQLIDIGIYTHEFGERPRKKRRGRYWLARRFPSPGATPPRSLPASSPKNRAAPHTSLGTDRADRQWQHRADDWPAIANAGRRLPLPTGGRQCGRAGTFVRRAIGGQRCRPQARSSTWPASLGVGMHAAQAPIHLGRPYK